MRFGHCVVGCVAFALSAVCPAKADAPKQMTIDQLKAVISNLGYDFDAGNAAQITIDNGKYKYPISFFMAQDNKIVGMYIILSTIPAEKMVMAPMCKLLYFNDSHSSSFSLNNRNADKRIVLNFTLPAANVSPATMRTTINNLMTDANNADKFWNPELWETSSFPGNCSP